MRSKILLFTALDHPLTSREHFLVHFLEEQGVDFKLLDVSLSHRNQNLLQFVRNLLLFLSEAARTSKKPIRLPSLPSIGSNQANLRPFINFLYSILAFSLVGIISRNIDYDVVVAADPVSAFIALSAKKAGSFFVYEDLDYFEDLKTGRIRRKFVSFLEKLALKRANLVVTVSKPLLKRAHQLNSDVILIPNGTNIKSFSDSKRALREPIMVYAGSIDEWAGLRLAIEALPLIRKRISQLKMVIIGDGTEKSALEEIVKKLSLHNSVFFTGKLPYDEMAAMLCHFKLGIASFKPSNAAAFASPLKLFDYMAAGLPIIATDIGDLGRIVRESKSGITINWEVIEFAEAAERILTNQNLWQTFHDNGLKYVEDYDWDKLFNDWLREIENRFES